MYKIKKERKYYIFDCIDNKYLATYEGLDALIEGIAVHYNYLYWWNEKLGNRLLRDYNCTMCDTINYTEMENGTLTLRRYVVFDDMFRIIDVRMYEKEILAYGIRKPTLRWSNPSLKYKYEKTKPEFRNGPVPNTGGGRYRFYRHPHTFSEIRQNSIPEHEEFVRKKRKYIPTVWDDLPRGTSRCWKDQSKKKKQWM